MDSGEIQSVAVPLPEFVREVALVAARSVIAEHVATCPITEVKKQVTSLEMSRAALLGYMGCASMFGSGLAIVLSKIL